MPSRIQRKRTKGWKMPPDSVFVGRPTKWGNPYPCTSKDFAGHNHAVVLFKKSIASDPQKLAEIKGGLKGKNLACWCPPHLPCHADVLLDIANEE